MSSLGELLRVWKSRTGTEPYQIGNTNDVKASLGRKCSCWLQAREWIRSISISSQHGQNEVLWYFHKILMFLSQMMTRHSLFRARSLRSIILFSVTKVICVTIWECLLWWFLFRSMNWQNSDWKTEIKESICWLDSVWENQTKALPKASLPKASSFNLSNDMFNHLILTISYTGGLKF